MQNFKDLLNSLKTLPIKVPSLEVDIIQIINEATQLMTKLKIIKPPLKVDKSKVQVVIQEYRDIRCKLQEGEHLVEQYERAQVLFTEAGHVLEGKIEM